MEWFPQVSSGEGDGWAALLVSNKLRMEGCGGGAWWGASGVYLFNAKLPAVLTCKRKSDLGISMHLYSMGIEML